MLRCPRGAHCAVRPAARPGTLPQFALSRDYQFLRRAEFHPLLHRKLFGSRSNQQDVLAGDHYASRQPYGIANSLHCGHRPCPQRASVHDDGVQLYAPVTVQVRSSPRIKYGIVFQHDHCRFNGIQCLPALLQNLPPGFQRLPASGPTWLDGLVGDVPRPTVHNQRRSIGSGQGSLRASGNPRLVRRFDYAGTSVAN